MAITLNSGFKIPAIGLGVWRMEKEEIRDLIVNSIKIGYRHFDCAADYQNEAEVGDALAEALQTGLVKREELFITTKLWNSDHGHVIEACKDSLKKLRLDYLDLYLVHFPVATRHTGVGTTGSALDDEGVLDIDTTITLETTWRAMEDLVSMGLVRSIGIRFESFLDSLTFSKAPLMKYLAFLLGRGSFNLTVKEIVIQGLPIFVGEFSLHLVIESGPPALVK